MTTEDPRQAAPATPEARVAAFLAELDRTSLVDFEVLVLGEPDPLERGALLDRVDAAARSADPDRSAAVDALRSRVRKVMTTRFAANAYPATWGGLSWTASPFRSDDRVRLVEAVEDAAIAALLEDRLAPGDRDALRERYEHLVAMRGTGWSGVLDLGRPIGPRRGLALVVSATVLSILTGTWALIAGIALRGRRRPPDAGEPEAS
jgi:hypothetical protein